MPDYNQLKKIFVKKSNRLIKSRLPDQTMASELIASLNVPNFDELTSIDQTRNNLQSHGSNAVIDLLTKASEDFLGVEIGSFNDKNIRLNPMDVVYEVLKNALPESRRILIKNLDKMKLALPLVLPDYSNKPKINIWPLSDISRQTREQSFNSFSDEHHVIAAVRIGNCDGFGTKLSINSKSEILNGVFFDAEQRFLSRKHRKMSNVMKKNQLGSIETCIHTPNKSLNKFLEIWNLQGNIQFEGLEPQVKLIKDFASVIVVILDNNEDLEQMNKEIIRLFGENHKIIVLLQDNREDGDSDTDSENEDADIPRPIFQKFDVIKFNSENMTEMSEKTRSLVSIHCIREGSFTLEKLGKSDYIRSFFDIDIEEHVLKTAMLKTERLLSNIKLLYRESNDMESLQKCFPLYYSKSSIDDSRKIVDHIDYLDKTKVQFFRTHQRGEFETENKIDEKIKILRRQQSQIAHESKIAVQYMNDIRDLQNEDSLEIQNEKIRLYHKGLAFKLARFNKDGIDIVGFQRELGQRFIALDADDERRKITQTLQSIVEAGVSIELVDGDTQNLNQDIIVSIFQSLRFEHDYLGSNLNGIKVIWQI